MKASQNFLVTAEGLIGHDLNDSEVSEFLSQQKDQKLENKPLLRVNRPVRVGGIVKVPTLKTN